jgi:hypothetical protein
LDQFDLAGDPCGLRDAALTMSRANKELLTVNSLLLANLVLLRRDAVLGPQRYKKEDVVFRKTRCSSFVPTHVFGPEAQAAVDAYKSDPGTALRELKQQEPERKALWKATFQTCQGRPLILQTME